MRLSAQHRLCHGLNANNELGTGYFLPCFITPQCPKIRLSWGIGKTVGGPNFFDSLFSTGVARLAAEVNESLMNTTDSPRPTGSLRGFWSFIATQFQGAFSDNVLKNLAIFVASLRHIKLKKK
jgi:hypothetical protein